MKKLNKRTLYTWLCVLIGVVMLLCTYPSMSDSAENDYKTYVINSEGTSASEIKVDERSLLDGVFTQVYPMYFDVIKLNDPQASVTQQFFPELKDVPVELKQQVIAQLEEVKREYKVDFPDMDYKVVNNDSTKEITKGTIDAAMTKEDLDKKYAWYFSFHFDNEGILHVDQTNSEVSITTLDDYYNQGIIRAFSNITRLRPYTIEEENNKAYVEYNIDSENRVEISSISKCKNTTFIFGITEKSLLPLQENLNTNTEWILFSQYNHEMFTNIMSISFVLFAALLIIFHTTKDEKLVGLSFVKKIPLEIYVIIVGFAASFIANAGYMVKATVEGKHFFLFNGEVGSFLGRMVQLGFENMVLLTAVFAFIAYTIAYFYDLFFNHEWKERSLIIKYWNKIITFITSIDMSDKDNKRLFILIGINFLILSFISFTFIAGPFFLIIYSVILFVMVKKYLSKSRIDYQNLLDVTKQLASGDLDRKIDIDLGMYNPFKDELQGIQNNIRQAVEDEVHSQRMKTELVTNVSHDLKTPLTSIITYIDLLKKEDLDEKDRTKYIDVLDKSSLRLKTLIEDLFEISKANSGNVTLDKMNIDIISLMKQVEIECESSLKKQKLTIKNNFSDEKILVSLDSQKMYRIFENLLSNVCKYALKGTRVYIDIEDFGNMVDVSIRNISAKELNFDPEEITERFTRGDKSRNTDGSGLGLAIAKSFTELHAGTLKVKIDGDLFKVVMRFPKEKEQ